MAFDVHFAFYKKKGSSRQRRDYKKESFKKKVKSHWEIVTAYTCTLQQRIISINQQRPSRYNKWLNFFIRNFSVINSNEKPQEFPSRDHKSKKTLSITMTP